MKVKLTLRKRKDLIFAGILCILYKDKNYDCPRDGHQLLACAMRIFPTNKQRQISVISIRMPNFPGNIFLSSCIINVPYFRESDMARIKDTFDPKKTSYVVFHSANKNRLGPALPVFRRSLARANHVSVMVGEGRGRGGTTCRKSSTSSFELCAQELPFFVL